MQQPPGPSGPHGPYVAQPYAAQPYAPPFAQSPQLYRQNVFVPPGVTAGPLVTPTLRKVKLALGVAQILSLVGGLTLCFAGAILGDDGGAALVAVGMIVFGFLYMLLFAYAAVSAYWVYRFWSWVPPDQRHTSMWKKYISPGTAVGFMFIPYFNLYWMFVIYLGLADIMERLRVQYPSRKGPAKNLAILTIVIPFVFFPAGPFLQYFFAKHVEEMAEEMHARMAPGAPLV